MGRGVLPVTGLAFTLSLLLIALLPAVSTHGEGHTVRLDVEPLAVEEGRLVPGASDGIRVDVTVTGTFGQPVAGLFVFAAWQQLGGVAGPANVTTNEEGRTEMLLDVPREQGQLELLVWTQDEPVGPPTGGLLRKVPVGDARETVRLGVPSEVVMGPAKVRTTVGILADDPQGTIRILLLPTPPAEARKLVEVDVGGRSNQEIAARLAEPTGMYGLAAVWKRPDGQAFVSPRANVTWIEGEEPKGSPGPGGPLAFGALLAAVGVLARRRGKSSS